VADLTENVRSDTFSRSSSASLQVVGMGKKMALVVWRTGAWRLMIVERFDGVRSVAQKMKYGEDVRLDQSRKRRSARDVKRYPTTAAAFIRSAMIRHHCQAPSRKCHLMNPNFPNGL
jgi:hypothetical protein